MKKFYFVLGMVAATLLLSAGLSSAQTGIGTLDAWKVISPNTVTPRSSSSAVRVPSLAGFDCMGTDGDGYFQEGTCTGGGGGSGVSTTILGLRPASNSFLFISTSTIGISTSTPNIINVGPDQAYLVNAPPTSTINGVQSPFTFSSSSDIQVSSTASTFQWYFTDYNISQFTNDSNYLTAALTSLGGQTGATQTFSTSSDTNLGLTITSAGNDHLFTPFWVGTLADGRITSASNWNAKEDALTFDDGLARVGDEIDFDCTEVEGTGINCSTNNITLDATGDWTGTVDGNNFGGGAIGQGDILYGSAAGTISELAKDANATRYLSNTGSSNNPAWALVDLSNGITDYLRVANGGTGTTTLISGVPVASGTNPFVTISGTDGQVLTASSSAPYGFSFEAAGGGAENVLTFTTNLVRDGDTVSVTSTPTFTSSTQGRLTATATSTFTGNVGIGTAQPDHLLHVYGNQTGGISLFERFNASVDAVLGTMKVKATSLGDMLDGFGSAFQFYIEDNAGVENYIADFRASRFGSDDSGSVGIFTKNAGVLNERLTINHNGIFVGDNDTDGVIQSLGSQNFVLKTGTSTTGSITIEDGANGNITIDPHGTGVVAVGTSTITTGGEIRMDGVPDFDHTAVGPTTNTFNASTTVAAMELVYMNPQGGWALVDADATSTTSGMLSIALEAGTNGNAMKVATKGSYIRDDTWNWTPGVDLYASTTPGAITANYPTGADDVIRTVGYAMTADVIYFDPSPDWITHL